MILKAMRVRIYPNKTQQYKINQSFNGSIAVWNYFLALKQETYKKEKEQNIEPKNMTKFSYFDMTKMLTSLKKEDQYKWLNECDAKALIYSLKSLDNAYKNFFRRVKNGETPGFPKFKTTKSHHKSYTTFAVGSLKADFFNNKIKILKVGWIRARGLREFDGKIKQITVRKESTGKYFASIIYESNETLPETNQFSKDDVIGIDLGTTHYIIKSDGEKINNPRFLKKYEKKFLKEQRKLSRKKKGSSNFHKQRVKVARMHDKTYNCRRDFIHKTTHQLTSEHKFIATENLDVQSMVQKPKAIKNEDGTFQHNGATKKAKLSRSVLDVSFYETVRQLEYKSLWRGKGFIKCDKRFRSTKTCSNCGNEVDKMDLCVRKWTCEKCGTTHDRDINAAINVKNFAIKKLDL